MKMASTMTSSTPPSVKTALYSLRMTEASSVR